MGKPPVKRHWLRENAAVRSPFRVLVIDTETRRSDPRDPDRQTLRLWSAQLVRRHDLDPGEPRTEMFRGWSAAELAQLVGRLAKRDRTTWAYCHNLSFDLAVTALPVELSEQGWKLTEGALTSDSPWARMSRKGVRLTLADSWSWLPTSVEDLGSLLGMDKTPLPANDAPDAEWWERCDQDARITAAGIVQVMDWWDATQAGNWSVTGPACGWGTYRHMRPSPRVLVDPSPEARALEARAIVGGRRDVRRTGILPRGQYADLDVSTCHLTVMGNMPLPARRFRHFDRLDPDARELSGRTFDVLAEVSLDARTPRYPWDSGRGVFYPVGRFTTTLAGPEIREARARGELVSIGPGYVYHVRPHMTPWALWLARILDPALSDAPKTVRLLAKHWSRCVPGKWAGRTSEVVSRIPDPRPGWAVERGMIARGRRHADFLRLGHEQWTIARDEWADDAFPAILAFIQSHTRVAVGRLLDALGASWLSVNTDGAMVDVRKWWDELDPSPVTKRPPDRVLLQLLDQWLDVHGTDWAPFQARVKGAWRDLTVYGAQHLITGGERRLAGIPRRAVKLANGSFQFTAWPKLRVQLIPDGPPGYRTEERTVSLAHIAPNGWQLANGAVLPVRTDVWGGRTVPQPPLLFAVQAAGGLGPADRQHALLRPITRHMAPFGDLGDGWQAPGGPEAPEAHPEPSQRANGRPGASWASRAASLGRLDGPATG